MKDNVPLIDTNILVYAYDSSNSRKQAIAQDLVELCWTKQKRFSISLQNLAEFFVCVTKKIQTPISAREAHTIIKDIIDFSFWIKLNYTSKDLLEAIEDDVHFWDALIAKTMLSSNIHKIYTENTKDFSKIQGIKAINPFI